MRVRNVTVYAAMVSLVLAGCGGDDDGGGLGGLDNDAAEQFAEDAGESGGGDVSIDVSPEGNDGDVSIDGDNGSSISLRDLPEGFPDDFPIPEDFELTLSSGHDSDFDVIGTSTTSVEDLDSYYADALPDAGYDRTEVGGAYVSFTISGNGWTGAVTITPNGSAGSIMAIRIYPA